jgi:Helix-turn-helix domain
MGNGELQIKELDMSRDELLDELRHAYEKGASIRTLVASTGKSYGSIHSMLRESGTTMRSRGGPNHRRRH